jgi:hypothetical protein
MLRNLKIKIKAIAESGTGGATKIKTKTTPKATPSKATPPRGCARTRSPDINDTPSKRKKKTPTKSQAELDEDDDEDSDSTSPFVKKEEMGDVVTSPDDFALQLQERAGCYDI